MPMEATGFFFECWAQKKLRKLLTDFQSSKISFLFFKFLFSEYLFSGQQYPDLCIPDFLVSSSDPAEAICPLIISGQVERFTIWLISIHQIGLSFLHSKFTVLLLSHFLIPEYMLQFSISPVVWFPNSCFLDFWFHQTPFLQGDRICLLSKEARICSHVWKSQLPLILF